MGKPDGKEMRHRLIQFFVNETRGEITKTQLVKFLYLADLYAVKWSGQQLTDMDWRFYRHGPWEETIEETMALMEREGKLLIQRVGLDNGYAILVRPGERAPTTSDLKLPRSLRLTLENIRREWAGYGHENLDALLDYVYSTEPMKAVKKTHDREEKVSLNLHLEREAMQRMFGDA